jgi:hypothetical protein
MISPCPLQAGATSDSERRGRLRPLQAKTFFILTMAGLKTLFSF